MSITVYSFSDHRFSQDIWLEIRPGNTNDQLEVFVPDLKKDFKKKLKNHDLKILNSKVKLEFSHSISLYSTSYNDI